MLLTRLAELAECVAVPPPSCVWVAPLLRQQLEGATQRGQAVPSELWELLEEMESVARALRERQSPPVLSQGERRELARARSSAARQPRTAKSADESASITRSFPGSGALWGGLGQVERHAPARRRMDRVELCSFQGKALGTLAPRAVGSEGE